MFRFWGKSSLSKLQKQSLLAKLQKCDDRVEDVSAQYLYFVDGNIADEHQGVLREILDYGRDDNEPVSNVGTMVCVIPRLGTISPWASKATDIAHNVGLKTINRIEKGIVYYVQGGDLKNISSVLHDRMV